MLLDGNRGREKRKEFLSIIPPPPPPLKSLILGLRINLSCISLYCSTNSFFVMYLSSDPYCKIKLFRGDREFGEIDSVVTETIKKVTLKAFILSSQYLESCNLVCCK